MTTPIQSTPRAPEQGEAVPTSPTTGAPALPISALPVATDPNDLLAGRIGPVPSRTLLEKGTASTDHNATESPLMARTNIRELRSDSLVAHTARVALRSANNFIMKSFHGFMLRSGASACHGWYQRASEHLAILEARRAYDRVPAYRAFVDQHCGGWSKVNRFSELPETSKKSYIKPYVDSDKLALYVDRLVPSGSSWDTSTGTSGNPTSWYRGPTEVADAYRTMSFRARGVLGRNPYTFINGFALGPWATGMTAARGVGQDFRAITFNVGSDPHMILQIIEESRRLAPERPVIVAGYPPHIEELVRLARETGVSLHSHPTLAVVGGEAMSELQRSRMLVRNGGTSVRDTGFQEVYSFYGASDLDINLAFETHFEIVLRRAMATNPELAKALLGENYPFIPMIFHYDPMTHLVEVNEKNELLFTDVSGNRISPRVRYKLGDAGTVRTMREVSAALQKTGITLPVKPLSKLPLIFVWGRIDDGITYRGANLAWENLEESLVHLELCDAVRGFGLLQYESGEEVKTDFIIQVPNRDDWTALCVKGGEVLTRMIQMMRRLNHDFEYQIARAGSVNDLPRLRIYHTDSPMAEHARKNPARKQQHIFLGRDASRALEIENGGALFTLSE